MAAKFTEISDPSIGPTVFADAISPDGSVVVGYDRPLGAFEWTQSSGSGTLTLLKDASGNVIEATATSVSNSPYVIVGTAGGAGLALAHSAFSWTSSAGVHWIEPSVYSVTANAVSEDGTIIAGDARSASNGETAPYTLKGGNLDLIPIVNGNSVTDTFDNTMSANGAVVAGSYSSLSSNLAQAWPYAWVDGAFIPLMEPGLNSGSATAVSEDGLIVVGEQTFEGSSAERAFFWNPASGSGATNVPLAQGFNDSYASGVSTGGTVIVGWMAPSTELMADTTSTAFIWDKTSNTTQSLFDYLENEGLGSALANWKLTEATAITPDGNTIVGQGIDPQGRQQSWIVTGLSSGMGQPPSTGTTTSLQAVNPQSPVYGQTVSLKAAVSVTSGGVGTPTGSVTFYDQFGQLGSGQLTGGTASISIGSLPVGTDTITARYGGSSQFAASPISSALNITVQKDGTSLVLRSSANSSTTGQSITFTAVVSPMAPGGGTPSGRIEFMDGNATLGTASLSGGQATLTTSTLPVGVDTITAVYLGDSSFNGRGSNALTEDITGGNSGGNPNPGALSSSTTLSAKPRSSTVRHVVVFTATVRNLSQSGGTPIGLVEFLDGAVVLKVVRIKKGRAIFQTSRLAVGTHHIQATYDGNGSLIGSASVTVSEVIKPARTKKKGGHALDLGLLAAAAKS